MIKRKIKTGTLIGKDVQESLIKLLHEYKDVFALSYKDMLGSDTNVVVHKLLLKSKFKQVKKKLRFIRLNMSLKIKEEVKKQFDVRVLIVAKYLEWIANIMEMFKYVLIIKV